MIVIYIIVIYMNYLSCKVIFFLSEKRKKSKNLHSLLCFCPKVTREKVYATKKRKKMTLQNARSSYL